MAGRGKAGREGKTRQGFTRDGVGERGFSGRWWRLGKKHGIARIGVGRRGDVWGSEMGWDMGWDMNVGYGGRIFVHRRWTHLYDAAASKVGMTRQDSLRVTRHDSE